MDENLFDETLLDEEADKALKEIEMLLDMGPISDEIFLILMESGEISVE